MKFKYIGRDHTNIGYKDDKFEVKENCTIEIDCKEDKEFIEHILRNDFIEVKMVEVTDKEVKSKSKRSKK